jgi:hypothetical protein
MPPGLSPPPGDGPSAPSLANRSANNLGTRQPSTIRASVAKRYVYVTGYPARTLARFKLIARDKPACPADRRVWYAPCPRPCPPPAARAPVSACTTPNCTALLPEDHEEAALCLEIANISLATTGLICPANHRPLSVNGMSVAPVCRPPRLHSVSPRLTANMRTPISAHFKRCLPPSNGHQRPPLFSPTPNR